MFDPLRKRGAVIFAGFIVLFIVVRLAVLFTHLDELYEPEELYRGTIAREIIHGQIMPIWNYLDYDVEYFPGGTLVVGMLAVPLFAIFGETYIALKLVGLFFALMTFVSWYLFLAKFFNLKTAILAGLLFVFCPPLLTKTSLITWGAHPEANLFTIASLYIFSLIFFDPRKDSGLITDYYRKSGYLFLALGIISGFAAWFVQTYLLTLLVMFLFWYSWDKRIFLRRVFYIFFCGALVGFLPGFYYAIFKHSNVLNVNGSNAFVYFLQSDLNRFLPKLARLIILDFPRSFIFSDFFKIDGVLISFGYYLFFSAGFIYLAWANRKNLYSILLNILYPLTLKERKLLPSQALIVSLLLFYPLAYVLAYALSGYALNPEHWQNYIGYRYMVPLMPFVAAIIAVFLNLISGNKFVFRSLLFLFIFLGVTGNLSLVSFNKFGYFMGDKGYSYSIVGDKIGLRIGSNLADYIKPFNKLEPLLLKQFYEGLGSGIAWRMKESSAGEIVSFLDQEVTKDHLQECYKGWGTLFAPEFPDDFARAIDTAAIIPAEYRGYFYQGFGRNINFFAEPAEIASYINRIEYSYRAFCYTGVGYSAGFEFMRDPVMLEKLIQSIPAEYQIYFKQGIPEGSRAR